jgi:hypothetical protein
MGNGRYHDTLPPETYKALSSLSKRPYAPKVFRYIRNHATPTKYVTKTRICNDLKVPEEDTHYVVACLHLFAESELVSLGTLYVEHGWNSTSTGKVIEKNVMWVPIVYKINSLAVREFSKMIAKKHNKRTR